MGGKPVRKERIERVRKNEKEGGTRCKREREREIERHVKERET